MWEWRKCKQNNKIDQTVDRQVERGGRVVSKTTNQGRSTTHRWVEYFDRTTEKKDSGWKRRKRI